MADVCDISDEHHGPWLEATIQEVRNKAATFDPGEAGECDYCGEEMPRIVRGACARCRDLRKLP